MVAKLLKHELYALFRVLVFFAAAVLLLSVAGRILLIVRGGQSGASVMATVLIIMFYVMSIGALIIAAYAIGANRFYGTLFTGEGYMTLSLPLSPTQLILGKLASSLIALLFAFAVSALSVVIFIVGIKTDEMQLIYSVFALVFDTYKESVLSDPLLFAENIIKLVVNIPMVFMIIFAVISVGQLFNSHRKGKTFGILIGVYFVWQILSSAFMSPFSALSEKVSPHLTNWIIIVLYAGINVGCFFFIRYILKNKVNLLT